jgi:hypothetical protein
VNSGPSGAGNCTGAFDGSGGEAKDKEKMGDEANGSKQLH